jgi:hypothetical protein
MSLLAALLALFIAALVQAHTFSSFVFAYLGALALLEIASRTRLRASLTRLANEHTWLALACLALLLMVAPRLRTLPDNEGLNELAPRLLDRLALTPELSLAPRLIRFDQPQTFFVQAGESASQASIILGEVHHEGEALGHGLFRFALHFEGATQTWDEAFAVEITVDGASHTDHLLAVRPLPHPTRIGVSENQACMVSEETDELRILNAEGALSPPMHAGDGPVDCAFTRDTIYIVSRHDNHILRLSGHTLEEGARIGVGAVALEALSGHLAVLVEGVLSELLLVSEDGVHITSRVRLEGVPLDLASAGNAVFVATRSPARLHRFEVEGESLVLTQTLELAMPAFALAANGREVVFATTDFRDPNEENRGNHFIEDQLVWLDAASLRPLRSEVTARRTSRQDHAGDADRGLSPISLAFDDEGALLVAFAGSFELARFPQGGFPTYRDMRDSLGLPRALVQVGGRYLATSASDGTSGLFDPALRPIRIDAWAPSTRALLQNDPNALRLRMGEHAFWEGTRAGASCQSCHPLGGTDGASHNIGGRILAPTLDTRGLEGMAPFLRDGSYPEIGDLYEVALSEYRGYRTHEGDRHATLDAYVRSLPLPRVESLRDLPRERRGLDAYFEAGCAGCHAPPAFTNLSRHAARALFPNAVLRDESISLDVPSLRGLRTSAPYLFDGRARTLEDVLTTANARNQHGDTASLTERERGDLLIFLETL